MTELENSVDLASRKMLTLDEVAAIVACSMSHLRRSIDAGHGPRTTRIGPKAVRVTVADACAWIDELASRPPKACDTNS